MTSVRKELDPYLEMETEENLQRGSPPRTRAQRPDASWAGPALREEIDEMKNRRA